MKGCLIVVAILVGLFVWASWPIGGILLGAAAVLGVIALGLGALD